MSGSISVDDALKLYGPAATGGAPRTAAASAGPMSVDEALQKYGPGDKSGASSGQTVPAGAKTSWGANIGASVQEGAASLANIMSDTFGYMVGKPVETIATFAHDVLGGGPTFAEQSRQRLASVDAAKTPEQWDALVNRGVSEHWITPGQGDRLAGHPERRGELTSVLQRSGLPSSQTDAQYEYAPGTRMAEGVNAAGGAPEVVADTGAKQVARAVIPAAMQMAAMGPVGMTELSPAAAAASLARGPVRPGAVPVTTRLAAPSAAGVAAAGGAAAAVGQTVSDWVPEEWKDVANMATQMAVLGGGSAIASGARGVGRMVNEHVLGPMGFGKRETVIDPATGQPFVATQIDPNTPPPPIQGTQYQLRTAGREIAKGQGVTPEEAAARPLVEQKVPGSQLTVGQATDNTGALNFERSLRQEPYGRAAFPAREAQNDLARVAAVRNLEPETVADAASGYFRQLHQDMKETEAAATQERQAGVKQVAEQAGISPALPEQQVFGGEQRETLETRRAQIKASFDRGYKAIDPDGTLALDTTPVAKAQKTIRDSIGPGGRLLESEIAVLDGARDLRGVNLFSDLRGLQSNIAGAMREIRNDPRYGAESQPFRRMAQLMEAVNQSIEEAAGRAAQSDYSTGAVGERAIDRLAKTDDAATGTVGHPSADVAEPVPGRGVAGAAGEARTGAAPKEPAGGLGGAPGDGVVAPAPPVGRAPASLLRFLIEEKGGLADHGDLRAMNAEKYHLGRAGRLIQKDGQSLDYAREAAVEAGYLPQGADINDFLNAVGDELAGRKVYRPEDMADATARGHIDREQRLEAESRARASDLVQRAEMDEGVRLSQAQIDHATDMVMRDPSMHPGEAIREAARADEYRELDRNAQRDALNLRPGVSPEARQAEADVSGAGRLVENVKPTTAAELRAENRRYREYKESFRTGAVGEVLASGGLAGGFRVGESAVPAKLFRRGSAGAEAADSLIRASDGDVAKAQATLGDYPARVLRDMAMKDGELSVEKYELFQRQYGAALAKFPDLAKRFETVAAAQREAYAAAAREQDAIKAYESSAARHYLGKGGAGVDNFTAVDRLASSPNAGAEARELMQQMRGNEAATKGVRRDVLDWFMTKTRSNVEAGTTGEYGLRASAAQSMLTNPKTAAMLRAVLSPDQMRSLDTTVKDMQNAARAWNAVQIKGSPGTAADLMRALKEGHGGKLSNLASIFFLSEAAGWIAHAVDWSGVSGLFMRAGGAWLGSTMNARKAAGIDSLTALKVEGVINPALGRVLHEKAVMDKNSPDFKGAARRIVRLGAGIPAGSDREH